MTDRLAFPLLGVLALAVWLWAGMPGPEDWLPDIQVPEVVCMVVPDTPVLCSDDVGGGDE